MTQPFWTAQRILDARNRAALAETVTVDAAKYLELLELAARGLRAKTSR